MATQQELSGFRQWLMKKYGSMGGAQKYSTAVSPQTPPAPPWLPKFVPGLASGRPIQKMPTPVPSGQQWGRTPWSQRQGLGSYLTYSAGTPGAPTGIRDVQDRMAMMQPKTPSGAGRQSWTPTRQWGT